MKVIIGLGNPGARYRKTRHNIGFLVLDELGLKLGAKIALKKWRAKVGRARIGDEKVILVKPQTYMNRSGETVALLKKSLQDDIDCNDILVISDDISIELGKIRLKKIGSSGGHRGLQSIIDFLDTNNFCRLRVGIRRPDDTENFELSDYVLSYFLPDERRIYNRIIQTCAQAAIMWVKEGSEAVMNKYNGIVISARD